MADCAHTISEKAVCSTLQVFVYRNHNKKEYIRLLYAGYQ